MRRTCAADAPHMSRSFKEAGHLRDKYGTCTEHTLIKMRLSASTGSRRRWKTVAKANGKRETGTGNGKR